jgi:potassium-transporting ATPase KdpC subunit
MTKHNIIAIKLLLLTSLLLGIIYPLAVTGLSQLCFPKQANGSLIYYKNKIIGCRLIGQKFTQLEYFHSRPSHAGEGYDAGASGGSNFGPTSKPFVALVKSRLDQVKSENPELRGAPIPVDMVTGSGSGLDPDISPASALAQVLRVAKARNLNPEKVNLLVKSNITDRQLGLLGEPRVNVLKLNLALDKIKEDRH